VSDGDGISKMSTSKRLLVLQVQDGIADHGW
jgi:hypothetical protein